jgi:SAM-dependent methyltransferase
MEKNSSQLHLVTHDAATLRFYADDAEAYCAGGTADPSRDLATFLDRLPPGGRILELGCGNGRDSRAMLARGFEVDVTDGVAEIARQSEKQIGHPVRVMRFDELNAVEAYDGVWAQACLLHVPRQALPGVLLRIFPALKPGGIHAASFKAGDAEGRDRLGRYYNYPSAEELMAAYKQSAKWRVLAAEHRVCPDYLGQETSWLSLTMRRSS